MSPYSAGASARVARLIETPSGSALFALKMGADALAVAGVGVGMAVALESSL